MTSARYSPKEITTATALAALQCIALERIEDDHGAEIFVATRGPFTKQFSTLEAFSAWLQESEVSE